MTMSCSPGTAILRAELSTTIITTYLSKLLRELEEATRSTDQISSIENDSGSSLEGPGPEVVRYRTHLCQVSQRLPHGIWALALQLLSD